MRPHRRQPTRLPHPWDSPGKNNGVGCHFLLQCMKVKSESEAAQLLATPWTAAYQAPPSMGFSRQEYWSGVPLPSPEGGQGRAKEWMNTKVVGFYLKFGGLILTSALDSPPLLTTMLCILRVHWSQDCNLFILFPVSQARLLAAACGCSKVPPWAWYKYASSQSGKLPFCGCSWLITGKEPY